MGSKDEFVQKMHVRLDEWSAEIDALSAKIEQTAHQAEADARAEYNKQIEALRSKRDQARSKLSEMESAGEGAWQDLKAGVELARESLGEALRSATARFK